MKKKKGKGQTAEDDISIDVVQSALFAAPDIGQQSAQEINSASDASKELTEDIPKKSRSGDVNNSELARALAAVPEDTVLSKSQHRPKKYDFQHIDQGEGTQLLHAFANKSSFLAPGTAHNMYYSTQSGGSINSEIDKHRYYHEQQQQQQQLREEQQQGIHPAASSYFNRGRPSVLGQHQLGQHNIYHQTRPSDSHSILREPSEQQYFHPTVRPHSSVPHPNHTAQLFQYQNQQQQYPFQNSSQEIMYDSRSTTEAISQNQDDRQSSENVKGTASEIPPQLDQYIGKRKRRKKHGPPPGSGAKAVKYPPDLPFPIGLEKPLVLLVAPGGPELDSLKLQKLKDATGLLQESNQHILEPLTLYNKKELFDLMASIAEVWKNSGKAAWKKRINKIKENARYRKAPRNGLAEKEKQEIKQLELKIKEREEWEAQQKAKERRR